MCAHFPSQQYIYPTDTFRESYTTTTPSIFASVVAVSFIILVATFVIYDIFVQRRNTKMVANAARSNAIVSSLFPSNIRDRLIGNQAPTDMVATGNGEKKLKSFLSKQQANGLLDTTSKPLADLFLETTVLFADVSIFGFLWVDLF